MTHNNYQNIEISDCSQKGFPISLTYGEKWFYRRIAMAVLHVAVETGSHIKKSIEVLIAPVLDIIKSKYARITKETKGAVVVPVFSTWESRKEIIRLLERAADDTGFIARLTYDGSKALRGYNLTLEEKAALLSGDIRWVEAHIGQLDGHLSTWLWCRLQQEIW